MGSFHTENSKDLEAVHVPAPLTDSRTPFQQSEKNQNQTPLAKECWRECVVAGLAELAATSILMFMGCSSGFIGDGTTPAPTLLINSLFGFAVYTSVTVFGDISGAHMNPWVTLLNVLLDKLSWKKGLVYVVCQVPGAYIGFYLSLAMITPSTRTAVEAASTFGDCCVTLPADGLPDWAAVLTEFLATSTLLAMVCYQCFSGQPSPVLALQAGLIVAALSYIAAPYTGCSMNITRSLPPSTYSGSWSRFWLLPIGQVAAVFFVAYTFKLFRMLARQAKDRTL